MLEGVWTCFVGVVENFKNRPIGIHLRRNFKIFVKFHFLAPKVASNQVSGILVHGWTSFVGVVENFKKEAYSHTLKAKFQNFGKISFFGPQSCLNWKIMHFGESVDVGCGGS